MTQALSLLMVAMPISNAFTMRPSYIGGIYASSKLEMVKKVFIDGEAGTTGLQVRERLADRDDIEILTIPSDLRKDDATRKEFVNKADAVILCLPDAASVEAASWVESDNHNTVLIDASTAFRVDETWTYGFPEMSEDQRSALKKSKRISNPGCYPTGFIGLTRPLVDAGILAPGTLTTVNAVSGYSGGGKALMELYESGDIEPYGSYGFGLTHKHIAEMTKYSGLGKAPIFQPQVSNFAQGMIVNIPLHYDWLKEGTKGKDVHEALTKHYEGSKFIEVMPLGEAGAKEADLLERGAFLRPDTLKNTNKMQLFVFNNDEIEQLVLSARLDNLGKGASGAAVQNMNIALGFDELAGL